MEALPIPRTMPLLCGRLLPLHRLLAEGPGPEGQRQEGTPPPLPALDSINLSSQEIDTGTVRRTRARLSDCHRGTVKLQHQRVFSIACESSTERLTCHVSSGSKNNLLGFNASLLRLLRLIDGILGLADTRWPSTVSSARELVVSALRCQLQFWPSWLDVSGTGRGGGCSPSGLACVALDV